MSKKIQLKGYLVYTPHDREPIFLMGGVASSCAKEEAAQYGGFVVPLNGELDLQHFVTMYEEQVDRYKELIRYESDLDKRQFWTYSRNIEKQIAHVQNLIETLLEAEKELERAKQDAKDLN